MAIRLRVPVPGCSYSLTSHYYYYYCYYCYYYYYY